MLRMKKLLICVLLAFVVFTCLTACAELAVGDNAPEISAAAWLNGNGLKLADNKDKIVVVEFWATWCPPCRASIPHLKKMNAEMQGKNIVFVSLTNENKATVEKFNEKAGMNWLVGVGSNTANEYGVNGIPHAFIIQNGKIIWEGHPMGGLEEKLKELVK